MASIEARTNGIGKTSYRVKVRLKGRPPLTATFERKTDAKRWAQDTESRIREGRYFDTAEAKHHTVADMIDRYTKHVLPAKKSARDLSAATQVVGGGDRGLHPGRCHPCPDRGMPGQAEK